MIQIRISLVSLVIAVLAGTAHSVPTKGTDVPGMRTEYSRTFLQADGRYTTQIYATPVTIGLPTLPQAGADERGTR
jgi:hypothetical protein